MGSAHRRVPSACRFNAREPLDRLRQQNGQTLTELVDGLELTRQTVTQHLQVLEEANLVVVQRRGRERLHYLNAVPIHEIQTRWIEQFHLPRLDDVANIKQRAEAMTRPDFVYVTYIRATAEDVWDALTSAELSGRLLGSQQQQRLDRRRPLGARPHRRERYRRRDGARRCQ